MAKARSSKVHAILGRTGRFGRWRLGPRMSIVAALGTCRLDLRQAQIDEPITKVKASVFLGSIRVVVPSGVEVRPSGLSLLSSSHVNVAEFEDEDDPPLIEIDWTSVVGKLVIGTAADLGLEDVTPGSVELVGLEGLDETTEGSEPVPAGIGVDEL